MMHVLHRTFTQLLMIVALSALIAFRVPSTAQAQPDFPFGHAEDTLAYVTEDNQLILYDPRDRAGTAILSSVRTFKLGEDGHIAYTRTDDDPADIYIYDPSAPTQEPINITQTLDVNVWPLAWSSDGRYLVFTSYTDDSGAFLYVWDGETTVSLTPDGSDAIWAFNIDWSRDGRLAFVVIFGYSESDPPGEIYVWDGRSTIHVGQNPQGWRSSAGWSGSGQLMFASQIGEAVGLVVWDGTSYQDGAPDAESFIPVAPELPGSSAGWLDDGSIGLSVPFEMSPTGANAIVWWDLASGSILRQVSPVSRYAFSGITPDGQIIMSAQLASGVPSVYLDVEDTSGHILFSSEVGEYSWSSGGYLAYCGLEGIHSRLLSIWDGRESWLVARVSYRPAQWQHAGGTFSCNNG